LAAVSAAATTPAAAAAREEPDGKAGALELLGVSVVVVAPWAGGCSSDLGCGSSGWEAGCWGALVVPWLL